MRSFVLVLVPLLILAGCSQGDAGSVAEQQNVASEQPAPETVDTNVHNLNPNDPGAPDCCYTDAQVTPKLNPRPKPFDQLPPEDQIKVPPGPLDHSDDGLLRRAYAGLEPGLSSERWPRQSEVFAYRIWAELTCIKDAMARSCQRAQKRYDAVSLRWAESQPGGVAAVARGDAGPGA